MPDLPIPSTQPETFAPFEIDTQNYAQYDEDIRKKALDWLAPLCGQARDDRQSFDKLNLELYNIWDCTTDIRWYKGRADIYFPAGHRAIERATAKQMARLFPTGDDTIDVRALPPGDDSLDQQARDLDAAKALMFYDLHHLLKVRKKFPSFLRQLNTLGTSPWALDYVTQEELAAQTSRQTARLVQHPSLGLQPMQAPNPEEVGPRGRAVDLMTWYVWPPTCEDLKQALLVFEDFLVTGEYLKRERAMGRLHFTDEELKRSAGQFPENSVWASSSRLTDRTNMTNQDTMHVLTMAYGYWTPGDAVTAPPEGGAPVETDLEITDQTKAFQFGLIGGDTICVLARQNPWWHQCPPYVFARLYPWINETYGRGLVYFIRKLQYQINDTGRQTFDAQTYSLNPIAAVDPALVPDPDALQYRPGAKWPVSPTAVRWLAIPPTHRYGFESIRQLFEMIQESAGAATGGQYLPTLGVARGAETATGQSLLVAQSDIDVNLIVEGIEEDVLEPLCTMIDAMEQQFLPMHQDRMLRALGQKAIPLLENGMKIRRDQLLGTRTYIWTGSHISEQREQFQKIGGEFLKIATTIPPDDKGRMNVWLFLKNLYRSFGFPDADNVFLLREAGQGFDPAMEHLVLAAGHPIPPKLGEDYLAHLQAHDQTLPQAMMEGWDKALKDHIAQTLVTMRDDPQFVAKMQAQLTPPPPGAIPGAPPLPVSPGAPGVPPGAPSLQPPGPQPTAGSVLAQRLALLQKLRQGAR